MINVKVDGHCRQLYTHDMNSVYKTLEDFGLTENEIKVYVEALKHDEVSPFKIARITGVPRTTVYDVMMSLSLKGLLKLNQSQGLEKKETRIKAVNPSILRAIIAQKTDELARLDVDVVDILPKLKKDFHKSEPNAEQSFYPGIEGVREVFNMVERIDSDVPLYSWNQLMPMDALGREWTNKDVDLSLQRKRELNKTTKNLVPFTTWTRHVLTYQWGRDHSYIELNEFRMIDNPIFQLYTEIYLYTDYVAIVCTQEDEVWGSVVHSRALAKTYQSIFEYMWQQAVPVTEQMIKRWGENKFLRQEQIKDKKLR